MPLNVNGNSSRMQPLLLCSPCRREFDHANNDDSLSCDCLFGQPTPWVGVTKPISSVIYHFSIDKGLFTHWISRSYRTDITTMQLRWHFWNMDAIQGIKHFYNMKFYFDGLTKLHWNISALKTHNLDCKGGTYADNLINASHKVFYSLLFNSLFIHGWAYCWEFVIAILRSMIITEEIISAFDQMRSAWCDSLLFYSYRRQQG